MALSRIPGDEELYVGGIFTLRRRNALEEAGITHILSVLKYDFKDFQGWDVYEHLNVPVDDVEDENLLGEFENTGAWIEEGLKKGSVLVHCAMGKSRSVTIVIAYLLRQYPHHTVSSALDLVREARPIAEPNDGFMAQLQLYKEMGCPRDIDAQPKYQRWLYQREVDLALAAGMAPDRVRFEDEEVQDQKEVEGREVELRCRKCRRTLATNPYIIPHVPGTSKDIPSNHIETEPISSLSPQTSSSTPDSKACTHHFLHPLSWMRPALEQGLLSGRLECPNSKCKAQIGRYAWQGMKCSCCVWVCPAFSLQKGRIDEIVKKSPITTTTTTPVGGFGAIDDTDRKPGRDISGPSPTAGGIRLPPGLRGKGNL